MKTTNHVLSATLKKQYPIAERAEGVFIYDETGKRYIDCAAGIAVVNIGHAKKEVVDAIAEQAGKISFVYGSIFATEARSRLASQIIDMAPAGMDKVFFCSGGSEAMESLIKIARQYQMECGRPEKYKIISRWQSYHGNTIAALAMGGRPSWRAKYDPYLSDIRHIAPCNCYHCPYRLDYPSCGLPCAWELERVIQYEGADTVAAFVLEPIVGTTAAAVAPPPEYLKIVRKICDKYDVVFGADEVVTGFGRTGKNFAVDHFGVMPDLIGVAKGLGSGYVPIGGVIVHKKIVDAIARGTGELTHSFTFSGNPLAAAGASAVLAYIKKHNLVERSARLGRLFLDKLKSLENLPMVGQVRGIGMLLAIEFVKEKESRTPYPGGSHISAKVVEYCFNKGVIVTAGVEGCADGVSGDAMQIAPPLIIEEREMDIVVETLRDGILCVYKSLQ